VYRSGRARKSTYHRQVLESRDEVVHTDDTRDVTRVITEEDTTKGSKGTHQVSLEGDGGLDASSVNAAPTDRASTTGHLSDGSSDGSGDVGISQQEERWSQRLMDVLMKRDKDEKEESEGD
jgi:hypothetical protein